MLSLVMVEEDTRLDSWWGLVAAPGLAMEGNLEFPPTSLPSPQAVRREKQGIGSNEQRDSHTPLREYCESPLVSISTVILNMTSYLDT